MSKKLLYLLMFVSTFIGSISAVHLLIKIPTRSRPEQFFRILDTYYRNLSGEVAYTFLITCDTEDKSMNNEQVIEKLKKYPHLFVYFSDNKSKVEAYNKDIDKHLDFDILLVTSDDMEPVVKGYDKIIAQAMQESFPDFDGVLNFSDGNWKGEINTLPIIGKKYYDRFGYVYHDSYKALWCDTELTAVSRALGKEKICNKIIIKHNHPLFNRSVAYDELYIKNDKWYNHDLQIFNERRSKNFFIQDILAKKTIDWSILICTLEERNEAFKNLYEKLLKQIHDCNLQGRIEILSFKDNRENKIGFKRNALLQQSKGDYVCFVDDDDDIHPNYISMIYEKLKKKPDCVSLTGIITFNGTNARKFVHSIKYDKWFEQNGIYYRCPNHLNVIKRSIAIKFAFPEVNFAEDIAWSTELAQSGLLKSEEIIDEPYYFYLYKIKKSI